jgi:8-oxo-dGTP pyrophosphatase MutT (NUDIX family)
MKNKHRNDIYDNTNSDQTSGQPAIPAATVVLLRDHEKGVQTLMLHRTSKVHFGGMWVFPGGRLDPEDYQGNASPDDAARCAAARETREETGLIVRPEDFAWFAHWTPPPGKNRRYATWFFATAIQTDSPVEVDGHEIQNHEWITPADALIRHSLGEIDLAPPTWITLHQLALHSPTSDLMSHLDAQDVRTYQTRVSQRADGVRVALWLGDAGYQNADADTIGARHRLVMSESGFIFENDVYEY